MLLLTGIHARVSNNETNYKKEKQWRLKQIRFDNCSDYNCINKLSSQEKKDGINLKRNMIKSRKIKFHG